MNKNVSKWIIEKDTSTASLMLAPIEAKNVDFHSAGGKDKSKNNIASRRALESSEFNVGKKALEDYGGKKK